MYTPRPPPLHDLPLLNALLSPKTRSELPKYFRQCLPNAQFPTNRTLLKTEIPKSTSEVIVLSKATAYAKDRMHSTVYLVDVFNDQMLWHSVVGSCIWVKFIRRGVAEGRNLRRLTPLGPGNQLMNRKEPLAVSQ